MPEQSYRFFQNKECKYFPCHEVKDESLFNCLFCYCPLYALGDKCGGNFKWDPYGYCKDCSNCVLPHHPDGYDYINRKYDEIVALAAQNHTPDVPESAADDAAEEA